MGQAYPSAATAAGNARATVVGMNEFAQSQRVAAHFEFVAETGSTNTDLIAAAGRVGEPGALPSLSVRVAGFQNAGRGRSGRAWLAPAGSSLFASVLLRPSSPIPVDSYAWLPLLAGLAMRNAIAELAGDAEQDLQPVIKWPNDLLIAEADAAEYGGHRKVAGVLSELLPDLSGVVIGTGVNIAQSRADLPVDTATSLAINGLVITSDSLLAAYLKHLAGLFDEFVSAGGDALSSGLRDAVAKHCVSIRRRVRVILPGDIERLGSAKGIDSMGRITVLFDGESAATPIAAGDIVHLRHN